MACSCTSDHREHSVHVRKSQEICTSVSSLHLSFSLYVVDQMKMLRNKMGKEQVKITEDNIEEDVAAVTTKNK
jgi:hypothetical protein